MTDKEKHLQANLDEAVEDLAAALALVRRQKAAIDYIHERALNLRVSDGESAVPLAVDIHHITREFFPKWEDEDEDDNEQGDTE